MVPWMWLFHPDKHDIVDGNCFLDENDDIAKRVPLLLVQRKIRLVNLRTRFEGIIRIDVEVVIVGRHNILRHGWHRQGDGFYL